MKKLRTHQVYVKFHGSYNVFHLVFFCFFVVVFFRFLFILSHWEIFVTQWPLNTCALCLSKMHFILLNNYDINRNIKILFLCVYLFKVRFNDSVPIIQNILGAGYRYIFMPGWKSTITRKQEFDWIIKMGCDLIGQKIDHLNTNLFKE